MVNTNSSRIHLISLQLLALILHHQWQVSQCTGLRGREIWRNGLSENEASPRASVLLETPSLQAFVDEDTNAELPPLMCPLLSAPSHGGPCAPTNGTNETTPVCQYNHKTLSYTTLCLRKGLSALATLPNAHPKSYCGTCRACFQDTAELQEAVNKYKSYKKVDTTLAGKYGWPIGQWCVDNVTSLSNLFFKKSKFNEDISAWDVSRVTDMSSTFQNAYAFNQPLNSWDTSRVKSMSLMFAMALHFDQDISGWDVSQVEDMGYMFLHALEFDQDICDWQVHNAFNLNSMFFGAESFRQETLEKWQISEHADTENMCEWTQQTDQAETS